MVSGEWPLSIGTSSQNSEVSYSSPQEMDQRFDALRRYGQLPRGRERRKERLSSHHIAAAIFGLVPTQASWAGHVATVLEGLRPVGDIDASFFMAETITDVVAFLLKDEQARLSFVRMTLTIAETGTNSHGAPRSFISEMDRSNAPMWRLWAGFGNMAVRSSVSREFAIYKSPPLTGFFSMKEGSSPNFALDGWGGRDRTSEWGNQNPLPYRLATPQWPGTHGIRPRSPLSRRRSIERTGVFQPSGGLQMTSRLFIMTA